MFKPIFSVAGLQKAKVWFVQALGLAASLALLSMGPYSVVHGAEVPALGIGPGPLGWRLFDGIVFFTAGAAILFGTWLYGQCYVMRAAVDEERGILSLKLAGLFWPEHLEVPVDRLQGSRLHVSSAPWSGVRIAGRRFPLIVDEAGDYLDEALVYRCLLGVQYPPPFTVGWAEPGKAVDEMLHPHRPNDPPR